MGFRATPTHPFQLDIRVRMWWQERPASDADGSLSGFRQVDCPLRLRFDEALSTYRDDDGDSRARGALTSHVLQAGVPPSCPTCSTIASLLLSSWIVRPAGPPGPALKSDQPNGRPTDKLQILSWNPSPARGSDPSALAKSPQRPVARYLRAAWRRLCHRQFPGGELLRGHPAPLCRAPQQGYFQARHRVHADPGPMFAQVLNVGRRGHGGYRQVPQGARPTVLLLHRRQSSPQQRVCQAEVSLYCPAPLSPRPVPQARRGSAHRRLQQGR